MPPHWRLAAQTFNERVEEYDRWFEDSLLFEIELTALRAITEELPHPRLEIGVGPGRFARALNVTFGIDPATSPLQLANRRGIISINAIGEQLPLQSESMGTVFLLFTLCFLSDPAAVFKECLRVMKPDGRLVIGFIPKNSPWGLRLGEQGKKGHPYYHHAHFRTIADTVSMLSNSGFILLESWFTLLQQPDRLVELEHPRVGVDEQAGFCVLICGKEAVCEICQPDYPDH